VAEIWTKRLIFGPILRLPPADMLHNCVRSFCIYIFHDMTATPPDPLATQHDGTPDQDDQGPGDTQTSRLREENRALRELLAAQVQASLPRQEPGWFKRLCWWLISAPGAALVGWRSLFGREDGEPITRRNVGRATMTVIYTLAIYGALVLLVVSWNSPNIAPSGATSASPMRVPLTPLPPATPDSNNAGTPSSNRGQGERGSGSASSAAGSSSAASTEADRAAALSATTDMGPGPSTPAAPVPAAPDRVTLAPPSVPSETSTPTASAAASDRSPASASSTVPERPTPVASSNAPAAPQSTLRMTVIPAPDPLAWVAALDKELEQCAELGFFERPECAWAARKQYCETNQGWGQVKECPAQP